MADRTFAPLTTNLNHTKSGDYELEVAIFDVYVVTVTVDELISLIFTGDILSPFSDLEIWGMWERIVRGLF